MAIKDAYEPGETVLVKQDKQEARIVRIFENGDNPLYEVVFPVTGWHKICAMEEIERLEDKTNANT